MMRHLVIILVVLLALPTSAMGELLVADLNEKEVAITTDFEGAELLLFGTIDHESHDDVVIIVEGPPKPIAIRQKSRVVGIWINTESATLQQIPSFYQISSTRPLLLIASRETPSQIRTRARTYPLPPSRGQCHLPRRPRRMARGAHPQYARPRAMEPR